MGFSYTFTSVKFLSARKKHHVFNQEGRGKYWMGLGGEGWRRCGGVGVKLFAMNLDDLDNDMTLS